MSADVQTAPAVCLLHGTQQAPTLIEWSSLLCKKKRKFWGSIPSLFVSNAKAMPLALDSAGTLPLLLTCQSYVSSASG